MRRYRGLSPPSRRARKPTSPDRAGAGRRPLVRLLVPGLLIALWSGNVLLCRNLWYRLPVTRRAQLDGQTLRAAFAAARPNYPPQAREALLLWLNSERLIESFRCPEQTTELLAAARATLPALPHTQVGRLQVAALTVRDAELHGVPPDGWWPRVQPLVAGMDAGRFPHFLPDLLTAEAGVYQQLGLPDAYALGVARELLDAVHGPFLQYVTDRFEQLATALEGSDAEAASACRRTVQRLLCQWVQEVGPPGLRLVAADLLARSIEINGPRTPLSLAVAAECRAWRAEYRTRAEEQPPLPAGLRLCDDPAVSTDALRNALIVAAWLTCAGLGAAVLTLLTTPAWLRALERTPTAVAFRAGIVVLLLCGVAFGISTFGHELIDRDFRRLEQPELGLPRLPMLAGASAIAAAALLALPNFVRTHSWRIGCETIGRLAVWLALWLGLLAAAAHFPVRVLLAKYEREFATVNCGGWLRPAPWAPEKLLDHLRLWNP